MQLNEGLEELGAKEVSDGEECEEGVFECSAIESVRLPSTLRRLEDQTFRSCKRLRNIEIPNGVECIGRKCFQYSKINEVSFPSTLREIAEDAFECCWCLKTVWVEESCALDAGKYINHNVDVKPK